MARKKPIPLTTLGKDTDKLTVQKSRPLFSLWQSDMTLAEFKILDTYLGRINSHNPSEREVTFHKGELENLLGVKRIRKEELEERLSNLYRSVKIEDNEKGFTTIGLFEKSVAEIDENGLWQVKMMCTPSAMKYVFNIEDLGYLRYKLRCITSITSRYSYILFTYLEINRFRKTWEIDLGELKEILNCKNEETYKEYKHFNNLVLKKVQKELEEKTEFKFIYEPIRAGRSVAKIRFTLETLPKYYLEDEDPNQITIEQYQHDIDKPLWESALELFDLREEQMEELRGMISLIPKELFPNTPADFGNIELMKYHYMQFKVNEIERRNKEKPIKHKYAYLLKLLKEDMKN